MTGTTITNRRVGMPPVFKKKIKARKTYKEKFFIDFHLKDLKRSIKAS